MSLVLLLAAVASASHQVYCPNLVCSSMPEKLCAFAAGNLVYANDNGCGEGICSLDSMLAWFSNTTETSYFLDCMPVTFKEDLIDSASTGCYPVIDGQELIDSIWPKECIADTDCELQNGEFAPCQCGLDGKMYCTPPITSAVFKEFWDSCDPQTNTTLLDTRLMWDWSHRFYTYILTGADCTSRLFYELDIDYIFDYVYNAGSLMTLIVGAALCT